MGKKFQKKNFKKRKYKYFQKPTTLWEMIDDKSKEVLLEVKAQAIMRGDKPYAKNKNKKRKKRAYFARKFRRRVPAQMVKK